MAVKIKLKRIGKMREPHYRIVVADARTKRSGRAIEEIGQYHPQDNPSRISVDSERAQYWLGVGAQPTEAVAAILRVTGDWQAFKGETAPPPMLMAEPKVDKRSVFETAAKAAAGINEKAATTAKAKKAPAKKAATEKAANEKPAPEKPAPEKPAPEKPASEKSVTDEPTAAVQEPAAQAAEAAQGSDAATTGETASDPPSPDAAASEAAPTDEASTKEG